MLIIGIDASNIVLGGGLSHLIELMSAACPDRDRFNKIYIFACRDTLDKLPERPWLKKISTPALEGGILKRTLWQIISLKKQLKIFRCDVLFVPGTIFFTSFKPVISMSQNVLPFEWRELFRYGFSLTTVRLILLRLIHSKSLSNADGTIFLTRSARQSVLRVIKNLTGSSKVIFHGINKRFFFIKKKISKYRFFTIQSPIRIIYVSIIDHYKHQWQVVKAVAIARKISGIDFRLSLVGPANQSALKKLNTTINKEDPKRKWVNYKGTISYKKIHSLYKNSHIGIWASTCETFGLILLEMMAAGLPILSSDKKPMKEILGNAGLYFNSEDPHSISKVLLKLINSNKKIISLSALAKKKAIFYTWERCAERTFNFIFKITEKFKNK
jgi:glycosyltransferase involved in cell wall biosynthesis